jgi:GNAT superfamily N-acetyltransferase
MESSAAIDAAGIPLGIVSLYPSDDYFTGHARAYVETLVVAAEAEGPDAGAALLHHAESWAPERGLTEIALDVFAGNARARAFYDRAGYAPDHIRLVKLLTG